MLERCTGLAIQRATVALGVPGPPAPQEMFSATIQVEAPAR